MRTYDLRDVLVRAVDLVDNVFIDPVLPRDFDSTDNKCRPFEHVVWWGVPFIKTYRPEIPTADFLKEFPEGVQYELRCLDGGAWDRSTWWGIFPSINAAIKFSKQKAAFVAFPVAVIGENNALNP